MSAPELIASPDRASANVASPTGYYGWLWALLGIYAAARVAQMFPGTVPMVAVISLHVLPPLAFAVIHGAMVYRLRGILMFILLCVAIGNVFENLSVFTGFPFGRYHFTGVMGPRVFAVPILLGLAYVGMGYISWTVARVILGDPGEPLTGSRLLTRPLVAAFVMVAWDFSQEAIWSNFARGWKWHEGGAYFGVPLSNFGGWYLTVYLIYQSFALTVRTAAMRTTTARATPANTRFWLIAVLFYGVSALGNLIVPGPRGVAVVTDAAGTVWPVSGILGTSALVSVLVMGAFTLIAWVRLVDTK
jgi:putative membrane protein